MRPIKVPLNELLKSTNYGLYHGTHFSNVDSIKKRGLISGEVLQGTTPVEFCVWGWTQLGLAKGLRFEKLDESFFFDSEVPSEGDMDGAHMLGTAFRMARKSWRYDSVAFATVSRDASSFANGQGEALPACRALAALISKEAPQLRQEIPPEFERFFETATKEQMEVAPEMRAIFKLITLPPSSDGFFHYAENKEPIEAISAMQSDGDVWTIQIAELMFHGTIPPEHLQLL